MNAKVFCLASPKGGSGKTIITANFASLLVAMGKKCLIVDCDSATHGLTLLYLHEVNEKKFNEESREPSGLFDLKNKEGKTENDVIKVENGIDFLPATYKFEILEELDEKVFSTKLHAVLDTLRTKYDYIFLDAQAGSDAISRAAMNRKISDEVIIVSEYDPLSAAGIERLKNIVGKDLEFTRTWVLLNKMLPEFVEKFSDFLSVARYLTPIPWNADVIRSYSRRRLAIDTEYGNEYTLAIIQTLKAMLGEKVADEIDNWASERASNIRQPLETQYSDSERELDSLLWAKEQMKRKREKIALYQIASFSIILSMMVTIFTTKYFSNAIKIISQRSDFFLRLRDFMQQSDISTPLVSLLISMLTIIVVSLTFFAFQRIRSIYRSKHLLEEARFDRKILVLEERLKQLEALKKADFKTLVKHSK